MALKDFFNKISNSDRIYTAEDIGRMDSEEFIANEPAIDYQQTIWEFREKLNLRLLMKCMREVTPVMTARKSVHITAQNRIPQQ